MKTTEQLLAETARQWAELVPRSFEPMPLKAIKKLIDRIVIEPDPEARLLLILRMLTDKWIMPLQNARVFGYLMASDKLPHEQKTFVCELCMEKRFPFVIALTKMGRNPQRRSVLAMMDDWINSIEKHMRDDVEPLMQLGSLSLLILPSELLRSPVVWSVRLGVRTAREAMDWCLDGLEAIKTKQGAHDARAYAEAASDVLLHWRGEFSPERTAAILDTLRQVHDIRARMAAYRVGTLLVSRDYARPGLEDRSNAVRNKCQQLVEKGALDRPLACFEEIERNS